MAESIVVDRGVSIVRRGKTWQLVVFSNGTRTRRTLGTRDKHRALTMARELAGSITSGTWNISAGSTLSVRDAVCQYRKSRADHAVATQAQTKLMLDRFTTFCDDKRRGSGNGHGKRRPTGR